MRDPRVERLLEAEGIRNYDFVSNFDVGKIKTDKAQTRLQGTDTEKVDEFAAAMKRQGGPRTFPAIAITADGELITGGHRHRATLKGGFGGIDAYVCKGLDPATIRRLRILGNVIEGDREPREDRLQHALHLVNGGGMTNAEAAEVVGLPTTTVCLYIRRERTKMDIVEAGASTALMERIKPTLLDAIGTIRRPALEAEMCAIVDRYQLSRQELKPLVQAVGNAASDNDAMAVIREFEDRAAPVTSKGKRPIPKSPMAVIESASIRLRNALRRLDRGSLTDEDAVKLGIQLMDFAGELQQFAEDL